ncbi:hypothetical protein [Chitinolyticbacter meiyuanensis]|uniref:hypothetical protein n=1 Tax=Chitinolyticbacter meiyuanensis TaxID=682798 RepID=UPI0011E5EB8E|nr:hypothetical protein [Chitinolyticbacter meiyuanensis]
MAIAVLGGIALAAPPTPTPRPGTVQVFKARGERQCLGGGKTIAQLRKPLKRAGLTVLGTACGSNGLVFPATCGADTSRIVVFTLPERQIEAALKLGYALLSDWPDASISPCDKP